MGDDRRDPRVSLLADMWSAYGRDPSSGAVRMMLAALGSTSVETLERSVIRLMEVSRFLPTIANILDDIREHEIFQPRIVGKMSQDEATKFLKGLDRNENKTV